MLSSDVDGQRVDVVREMRGIHWEPLNNRFSSHLAVHHSRSVIHIAFTRTSLLGIQAVIQRMSDHGVILLIQK